MMPPAHSVQIRGVAASGGIAFGTAFLGGLSRSPHLWRHVPAGQTQAELARLEEAVGAAVREIEAIRRRTAEHLGEAHLYILDMGLMLLKDEMLLGEARRRIREERRSAEWAVRTAAEHFSSFFDESGDPYLRDRRFDVLHAADRIIRILGHAGGADCLDEPSEPVVFVARDLTPADVASFAGQQVVGFVTEIGAATSHTAILAEALGIPAVVGAGALRGRIATGDALIVDGSAGTVLVNPPEGERERFRALQRGRAASLEEGREASLAPALTRDGVRVAVHANVEHDGELEGLSRLGVDGVGLYRSDHLFFNRASLPSEEEHFVHYHRLAQALGARPAFIRTFDLGGDRDFPAGETFLDFRESNPAMGSRAIRICLARPEIIRPQIRAILRAAREGNLSILYPMISAIEEIRAARALVGEVEKELRRDGVPFRGGIPQGILIETPAAALCADQLAREADFLCVGTNDLTQFTLAVDRSNQNVAGLYAPFHPAMLRLLGDLSRAAGQAGVPVTVCGELAGDPVGALCLLALGYRSLSMAAPKVGPVKRAIRRTTQKELDRLASALRECETAQEARAVLEGTGQTARRGRKTIRPAV